MRNLAVKQQKLKCQVPVMILAGVWMAMFSTFFFFARWQETIVYAQTLERVKDVVAEENLALKDKLDSSSKITTPDTTKELVRYYIRKYFPKPEWGKAEKIFTCESNMNPNALNTKNKNKTTDRGVVQLNSVHAGRFEKMYGIRYEIGAHDIDLSIKYAKFLWDHSSWNPWVCAKVVNL